MPVKMPNARWWRLDWAMRTTTSVAAVVSLGMCTGPSVEGPSPDERPPTYADGYRDGCESAKHAAGWPLTLHGRDNSRYENDPQYRQGYDSGYNNCEIEYRRPRIGAGTGRGGLGIGL
jgi:hypothetical protein